MYKSCQDPQFLTLSCYLSPHCIAASKAARLYKSCQHPQFSMLPRYHSPHCLVWLLHPQFLASPMLLFSQCYLALSHCSLALSQCYLALLNFITQETRSLLTALLQFPATTCSLYMLFLMAGLFLTAIHLSKRISNCVHLSLHLSIPIDWSSQALGNKPTKRALVGFSSQGQEGAVLLARNIICLWLLGQQFSWDGLDHPRLAKSFFIPKSWLKLIWVFPWLEWTWSSKAF